MEIIVREFKPHYNVALGKVIKTERQYKEEIKRGGYIPYEQAQEIVASNLAKRKEFKVSDKAMDWMRGVKDKADRKGNVKLSEREVEALHMPDRENPALKEALDSRLPEHYRR